MKRISCLALLAVVGGCSTDIQDIGRAPHMTPVGSGLSAYAESVAPHFPSVPNGKQQGSLWQDARSDLFRDARAVKIGDLLTVNISINDSAQIGNETDRSRQAQAKSTYNWALSMFGLANNGANNYEFDGNSTNKGQGNINRSEKIQLQVAAVVTDVLPNGNLVISGSQEMRVNFELRALEIVGIVRPRDISRDNKISYDKIAEARVSYGGRGRLTEVQQPAVGQQLHDIVTPF